MAYISLYGRSIWASLNTFYAVLLETDFKPEQVIIVTETEDESTIKTISEGVDAIATGFDLEPKIFSISLPEGDIVKAGEEVRGLLDSLRADYETALDITSARKAVVAGALLATADKKPDHIYYLEVDNLEDKSKPYVMIPSQQQRLHDLREETRRTPQ